MKTQIKSVLRSGKFMVGFVIFVSILLTTVIYPIVNPGDPMARIGYDSFRTRPGTYVSLYDSLDGVNTFTFKIDGADDVRVNNKLRGEDSERIKRWLVEYGEQEEIAGLTEEELDVDDIATLLEFWWEHYSDEIFVRNLTNAERNAYMRLDSRLDRLFDIDDLRVYTLDPETDEYDILFTEVSSDDYVNINDIANVVTLPLGTDNFGSDVLRKLVLATSTSLWIGLVAGTVATLLGLSLGLLAGYLGGIVDDIIMFFTNLFTVIPGFVLLILISYGMSQMERGATTVAVVIGLTSWVWTTRSVRSQVLSLRNRDHVNLSKLSGHSMPKIVVRDILPYIASYVVMAFILQISSGILAEAGLSMLGLGPSTTSTATLGLMMDWSIMKSTAFIHGAWWAYYPVITVIVLISFSLNLMNTGMDQVFNPQLRD